MNYMDASLHGKAPKFEFPPKKWSGYPTVVAELNTAPWQLEVGTGSKQTLIMEKSIRKRFNKAIGMEFDAFIGEYANYLKDEIITLHFEMIVEQYHQELTVHYSENFCKFIGSTTFTDTTRSFALAEPTAPRAVQQKEFHTLSDCEEFIEEQHQKLLMGDMHCEPEGFVLYVYDESGLKDIVKRKFLEYLAANNPQCHPEEYNLILNNPLLVNRFQKCRNVQNICKKVVPLAEKMDKELTENWTPDRKMFALYLEKNKDKFEEWQKQLTEITDKVRLNPIKLQYMIWKYFPGKDAFMEKLLEPFKQLTK
ncbi:hypothetical protein AVEN_257711-1 [Araneus ventricosus]|uniref:Uncharacterized protein n=1 Tax=Araneus ventricosus TaxID=182803 RepID=A0A4Y2LF08_ARAVE|nr:hypothetical protein AVEN_257711-1 [Araneus ventricosus]